MLPTIRRRSYQPAYLSDLFDNQFNTFLNQRNQTEPAVNIREDEKNYYIELALAGMDKEEIKIEIEKEILVITSEKGETKEGSKNGYSQREFGYQSFCKSFRIPEGTETDKIKASYNNGILGIEIPRVEEKASLNKVIKIS